MKKYVFRSSSAIYNLIELEEFEEDERKHIENVIQKAEERNAPYVLSRVDSVETRGKYLESNENNDELNLIENIKIPKNASNKKSNIIDKELETTVFEQKRMFGEFFSIKNVLNEVVEKFSNTTTTGKGVINISTNEMLTEIAIKVDEKKSKKSEIILDNESQSIQIFEDRENLNLENNIKINKVENKNFINELTEEELEHIRFITKMANAEINNEHEKIMNLKENNKISKLIEEQSNKNEELTEVELEHIRFITEMANAEINNIPNNAIFSIKTTTSYPPTSPEFWRNNKFTEESEDIKARPNIFLRDEILRNVGKSFEDSGVEFAYSNSISESSLKDAVINDQSAAVAAEFSWLEQELQKMNNSLNEGKNFFMAVINLHFFNFLIATTLSRTIVGVIFNFNLRA